MTDSKTAKKIQVVPCGHDECESGWSVIIDGRYHDFGQERIRYCGTEAEAQAKAAELAATELVEPAPRPQCSCDCPNYDSGCPVHGTPKHIADRGAAPVVEQRELRDAIEELRKFQERLAHNCQQVRDGSSWWVRDLIHFTDKVLAASQRTEGEGQTK